MQLVAERHKRQVRLVALDLGTDTATPAGPRVLGIFAALAVLRTKYDPILSRPGRPPHAMA